MMFKGSEITPGRVHATLSQHMLVDGYPFVVDLEKSHGSWIRCAKSGGEYLDFFSYFSSLPLGHNHPVFNSYEVESKLLAAAKVRVSNSDVYTTLMAEFVSTLYRTAAPSYLPYVFFIDGGSAAVENAIKVACDYTARRNQWSPYDDDKINKLKILHFKDAFHGRNGYSLSVTNTARDKIDYFPKFAGWHRIDPPYINFPLTDKKLESVQALERIALRQIESAFKQDAPFIAGLLVEPITCEGGDLHYRPEFFQAVRRLLDTHGSLLIVDEVQTGLSTGKYWWGHQHHGIEPDILCFGKKMQTCGIMASKTLDRVEEHCFKKSSRINSTFGGSLVDFVRCTAILETIVNDNLLQNAEERGKQLLDGLIEIQSTLPTLSNARGRGLIVAIDLPTSEARDGIIECCYELGMIVLPCGKKSIRFRPSLTITADLIAEGLKRFKKAVESNLFRLKMS